ncbi:MAG TPA: RluA family pseudouridine synthase [Thermoanaerobaculia bacterium]|jgi:tRNA pseudouridine32 synthase/23S rRNA pseudouridine746 synthase/23S rRNA pseudouridine1911/1915/1917 synthase|nr:RluA family pseudouridine synthase [Thermoanaerobaculia bacterium]
MTTLLDVLQERFPESSKTTLRTMLKSDRVRVNGEPERDAKRTIEDSDQVTVAGHSARLDPRIRIVYEDAELIVIEKAAHLLSVPTEEVRHENAEALVNTYTRVMHVHRLDRDTSGVLVFAKNAFVRDRLQELFAKHDIERTYVAVVFGKLTPPSGTFRSFLFEDRDLRVRVVEDASKGKEAITHYRTVASGKRYSMLELTLETGRRNQIRVQLAHAGHPIVGDTMYGKGRDEELRRLALHAKVLGFVHPRTGEKMRFTTEIPREFRELKL